MLKLKLGIFKKVGQFMYIKNRTISTIFRLFLVGLCAWGIWLNLTAWDGNWLELLSFYTLQSNILVLVFFIYLLIRPLWTKQPPNSTVKGAVTVAISLTLLVYHFVLRPTMFSMAESTYGDSPANILAHYVTPLMVIADWLLFDRKGMMTKFDPFKWLLVPLAYLVFAIIRAQLATFSITDSRWPYFFMDFDKYGIMQVVLNCSLVTVGYLALGYLVDAADYLMAKLGRLSPKKPKSGARSRPGRT